MDLVIARTCTQGMLRYESDNQTMPASIVGLASQREITHTQRAA